MPEASITSIFQPLPSANFEYMRKRSETKSAASSPARAGADLHDGGLVGELVAGGDEVLEPRLERGAPILELLGLASGELHHLGVGFVLD